MRRVVIGTAGHVDHGKTRLVEALTGVDCDRWEEEKRRGITIDLGFAHFVEGDLQISFVDVPGHERFLHNALAGLGGIRVVLLVVAADEGVQPQTREHLAVCDLLEIPAAVVALTKSDLAGDERLLETQLELEDLLAGTRYADAPALAVSAATGDGVAELRALLVEHGGRHARAPDAQQADGRPARLPIDRAFLIRGHGLIVTGTLAAGTLQSGETLTAAPSGGSARIRNVQVHGEDRERAHTGERVALQIAGVDVGEVPRGSQLIASGSLLPGQRWLARFRLLSEAPKPIRGTIAVRVHLFSSEVIGKLRPLAGPIEPGGEGAVQIRLARPLMAARGDRFIVRRPSPAMTLGGGAVLDPLWHKPKSSELAGRLEALEDGLDEALKTWVTEAGEGGASTEELSARLGLHAERCHDLLEELASGERVVRVPAGQGHGERWVAPAAFRRVEGRAHSVLKRYFGAHRTRESMPRAEAVAAILPGRAADLAPVYLGWLEQRKVIETVGKKVRVPGRAADLTGRESEMARQILAAFEAAGLTPPPPSEVRATLGGKTQILDGVTQHLLEAGKLTRLPGGLLIATAAVDRLRQELKGGPQDDFGVGDFKQRFDLTRKWAIPLLEHLDSTGVTRRVGNVRQIVR